VTTWAKGNTWPGAFNTDLNAAVWGGPSFPNYWYFFKDNVFIRVNTTANGQVDVPPTTFAKGGWGSVVGTDFANGLDAALHGTGTKYCYMTHLFKGSQYIRHNLKTGQKDIGPVPITDVWSLPAPFSSGIDLAFYGSGDRDSDIVYFFKGAQCLPFNTKTNQAEDVTLIETRFPALARYIPRPQLFLVEDYELDTYVGPVQLGQAVQNVSILPNEHTSMRMIVERTDTTSSTVSQSFLQNQQDSVANDFYSETKSENKSESSSDAYRYQMDASFHGDASADSVWGGEVNAQLGVKGGSDDVRSNFANAAFGTISQQVKQTSSQVTQRVTTSTSTDVDSKSTLFDELKEFDNRGSSTVLSYEFYTQVQPTTTLLVLKHIGLAFLDGAGAQESAEVADMDIFLSKHIASKDGSGGQDSIRKWIVEQLSSIRDAKGTQQSVIKQVTESGRAEIQFDPGLTTTYSIKMPDGSDQVITVAGLVKAASNILLPMNTMTAVAEAA